MLFIGRIKPWAQRHQWNNSDLYVVPSVWTWAISIQTPSTAICFFFTFNTHTAREWEVTNAADSVFVVALPCYFDAAPVLRSPILTHYHQWMFATTTKKCLRKRLHFLYKNGTHHWDRHQLILWSSRNKSKKLKQWR